jgi:hypothetical protein
MALSVSTTPYPQQKLSVAPPVKAQPIPIYRPPVKQPTLTVSRPVQAPPIAVNNIPIPQQEILVDNSPRFVRLGAAVKAKYPGIYDSMDDGVLGKIVATKYPDIYNEFIDPATALETSIQQPKGKKGFGGFLTGALKGAASTLNSISRIGQKALQKLTGLEQPVAQISKDKVTPRGLTEKLGFGAEQIAEFFIPAGAVSKVGKVAETGIEGFNLANKVGKVGNLAEDALKLGTKVGLGAGEAAGVTAAQGGDKSDIKLAASLGGGLSVVAKGIESILNKVPQTAWSSILKRTPIEAAKSPLLPKQAVETGLTGLTRDSIANKAQSAIQSIEVTLDDLLSKSSAKINPAKIAGYLGDLRQSYAAIPGEQPSVKVIDNILDDLYSGFKEGKSLSAVEANQLKRDIYSVIAKSYGKGAFEIPAKVEAQKTIARGLKTEIEKVIPEAKTLNERQAVYIQIKKALDKTIARTEGKGIAETGVGLYDLLIGGIGTGAGAATGNPLLGLGVVAVKKTAESPIVLSSTAKLLNYFNTLSPTKKLLFYQAIKGLTIETGIGVKGDAP